MKNFLLTCLALSLNYYSLNAQSYIGHRIDNYSGIHGIILNPSAVVDSRLRTDINIFSVSAFVGSDYFEMNLSNLTSSDSGFDFDEDSEKFPKEDNQFFLNIDVLGPSFMFNLSPVHSLGFTTRARAFLNLNNINGELYENLSDNFEFAEDFDFNMKDFTGTIHAWGELGVTYGRILMDENEHFLKGGVTLKYLYGGGSVFANTPQLAGNYSLANEILTTSGSLNYGSSMDFDSEDIDFSNTSSGFGGDIGFTYEYRNSTHLDSLSKKDNKYKFKIGISLTDIGSISYNESTTTNYNLNGDIDKVEFENKSLEEILDDNYVGTEQILDSKINLPTALHFIADYNLRKRIYISLNGSFSLIADNKEQANRIINTLVVSPRFESRWLGFHIPLSLRQYDGLSAGVGLRAGPLIVGSASAITNLLSSSSKTTDVYLGLKVPFYQKN
jgi:hypothetical protein